MQTSCRFTDEACTDSLQPFEYMEPDDRVMTHNLMEECQENMKLLVSLNRNTMDGMLTVWTVLYNKWKTKLPVMITYLYVYSSNY